MAEVVSAVVKMLISLTAREAKLLQGVCGEIESMKDELESIAPFLAEADAREARGDSNDTIRVWVRQVRKAAHSIEDVMDEYMYHVARRRLEGGVSSFVCKPDRSVRKLVTQFEIASKVQKIKKAIVEMKSRADRYSLIGSIQQQTTGAQIRSLFCEDGELVGMEGPRHEVSSWLQEDQGGKRMVFSVVGMGGLGKTTLVRKVYDTEIPQFHCYAWITVSQTYSINYLLKSIIRQFHQAQNEHAPTSLETLDEINQLVVLLRAYVGQKRYVVVFDDVWSKKLCEDMICAFPENSKCSRIIFTTRSEDVAPSSLCCVYKLPLLPPQKSFQLFCRKVFQSYNEGRCPPELMELSMDIVKKCEGLPLAVITVGGILSTKQKSVSEWLKFQTSLRSKLESDEQLTRVNEILSLSYYDLPLTLKSCLLYFGIYPEDCSIRCSRLIRQWIAEDFVRAKDNQVLEDVAEEYLSELIHRNVIQVSSVDSKNRARECRVHDLMREVIILKLKDMRFCSSMFGEDVDARPRRLSLVKNDLAFSDDTNASLVRSLFVFQISTFSNDLFENMKLLKMLDLEGSQVKVLPECVGVLYHLSYLSVRKTEVEMLPKSIGKLVQLQTLDFKESRIRQLPVEIKRLRKLRHLLGYSFNKPILRESMCHRNGFKIQGGLECWETLQKLSHVEANSGAIVAELIKFNKLRKLGVTRVRREDVTQLCKAIEDMKDLWSLEIEVMDKEQVMDLESIDSPPPHLQTLSLIGRLEALPRWFTKLQNTVRISLRLSGLANDRIESLQDLPNLLYLSINEDAYKADRLHFKRGGFPKLKSLALCGLKVVKELIIEQGALPHLEELEIGPFSTEMMEVPSSIQHLTNLKVFVFRGFSHEFYMKIVPQGPSWTIIQHIPQVGFRVNCSTSKYGFELFTPATYKDRK